MFFSLPVIQHRQVRIQPWRCESDTLRLRCINEAENLFMWLYKVKDEWCFGSSETWTLASGLKIIYAAAPPSGHLHPAGISSALVSL